MKRLFVVLAVMVIVGLVAAQCAPAPAPERIVETVVVEGTPQVVEKVVTKEVEKVVTKEVEVEKVVTPTPVTKDTLIWAMGVQPINLDPTLQSSIADYSYAQK